jgi:hypothetical protein
MKKSLIYGCEGRGDGADLYLTRYTLLEFKSWQLCLHVFHRSDADDLHDHPWDFYTMPLWRGYKEVYHQEARPEAFGGGHYKGVRPIRPFRVYFRKAEHTHRVVLYSETFAVNVAPQAWHTFKRDLPAVTLVLMLKKRREWGFWMQERWVEWRQYFFSNRC